MKYLVNYFNLFLLVTSVYTSKAQIHAEDIPNFWRAFDSIQTTENQDEKVAFLQTYYLNKASNGLAYAIQLENGKPDRWMNMIAYESAKLNKIRQNTLDVLNQKPILEKKIAYFRQLYPEFQDGEIYLIIGPNIFGGKVNGHDLIIGAEVVVSDKPNWAVPIVLHEFVHTFQNLQDDALLAHCILEGTADFVAELVNQESLREIYPGGYIDFGYKNDRKVWNEFKKYIGSNQNGGKFYDWLYGSKGVKIAGVYTKDLGYYLGYRMAKSYYERAEDKTKALREIIEYDLSTNEKAKEFLLKSGYVPKNDEAFVKNLVFAPVVLPRNKGKKNIVGYRIKGEKVVFRYQFDKDFDASNIRKMAVVGSFNDWNPENATFTMAKTKNPSAYELVVPKSTFESGKTYTFKFVGNGEIWIGAPENAINVEEGGYGNFTLKIN